MNKKIIEITEMFKKYDFDVKYDVKKGFHVVRKAGRDAYVYIKYDYDYNQFCIKFMSDIHSPIQLERELPRINELIKLTKEANEILES